MEEVHDKVVFPLGVGIPMFESVHVMPVDGLAASVTVMVPVRPPLPVNLTVENGLVFTGLVKPGGFGAIVMLLGVEVTVTRTVVVLVIAPLVPPVPLMTTV